MKKFIDWLKARRAKRRADDRALIEFYERNDIW